MRYSRPPHPAANVRDDRETPLCVGRDGMGIKVIWGRRQVKFCNSENKSCSQPAVGAIMAVATWLQAFKLAGPAMAQHQVTHQKDGLAGRCPVAAVADDETLLTQLKKAITEATRTHGYVECRAMRGWLLGIESVLDRTAGLITSI
jgi:hypothetical protein